MAESPDSFNARSEGDQPLDPSPTSSSETPLTLLKSKGVSSAIAARLRLEAKPIQPFDFIAAGGLVLSALLAVILEGPLLRPPVGRYFCLLLALYGFLGLRSRRVLLPVLGALVCLGYARAAFDLDLEVSAAGFCIPATWFLIALAYEFGGLSELYILPLLRNVGRAVEWVPRAFRGGPKPNTTSVPELSRVSQVSFEQAMRDPAHVGLDGALAEYIAGLQIDPKAPPRGAAALTLAKQGRVDESIIEFQAQLSADPTDVGAYFHLGMLLAGRRRHLEAAKAFVAFVAHSGRSNPGHVAFARARIIELKRKLEA